MPAILETEDRRLRGQNVEDQARFRMAEAADNFAVISVVEPQVPHSFLEPVVVPLRRYLDDDVDVCGSAGWGSRRIGDPKFDRGAADEDALLQQRLEMVHRHFEHLNVRAHRLEPELLLQLPSSQVSLTRIPD